MRSNPHARAGSWSKCDTRGSRKPSYESADRWIADAASLGGNFTGDPMVGRNKDGRIDLFARDKDGQVQFRVQREPAKSAIWDGWYSLGGKPSEQ